MQFFEYGEKEIEYLSLTDIGKDILHMVLLLHYIFGNFLCYRYIVKGIYKPFI